MLLHTFPETPKGKSVTKKKDVEQPTPGLATRMLLQTTKKKAVPTGQEGGSRMSTRSQQPKAADTALPDRPPEYKKVMKKKK